MKTFGERMRWARDRKDLKQDYVCEQIGIKQASLSQLENSKSTGSKFTAQFARLYEVDAYWLATGKGQPDQDSDAISAMIAKLPDRRRLFVQEIIQDYLTNEHNQQD